jgi:hypothetical protein
MSVINSRFQRGPAHRVDVTDFLDGSSIDDVAMA